MSFRYAIDFDYRDFIEELADVWIQVPILEGRGAGRERRKWAKRCAELRWGLDEVGPRGKSDVKALATMLENVSERLPQKYPMQHLFLYGPDIRRAFLPFLFYAALSNRE